MTSIPDKLLEKLTPHICIGCSKENNILCYGCSNDAFLRGYKCVFCSHPVNDMDICVECISMRGIYGGWITTDYSGVAKKLVREYKFESKREAAVMLAKSLIRRLPILPDNLIVTSVPTIRRHIRIRGFDHARLIAKEFAASRDNKYDELLKRDDARSQVGLKREARLRLGQPFSLIDSKRDLIKGSDVLVIDDVITTGATITAAVKALQNAGAGRVFVAAICGPSDNDDSDTTPA